MTSGEFGNLLYVGSAIGDSSIGGREQLSQLIRHSLLAIGSGSVDVLELPRTKATVTNTWTALSRGHVDGVSRKIVEHIIATIESKAVRALFLDGSNLGSIAKAVKRSLPHVQVITFFHNCEARFFLGALRRHSSVRTCGVLLANYLAERSAVRFSDKRICLNERDGQLLQRLYGRGATHISPLAMQDQLPSGALAERGLRGERYALFVGGTFYANRHGIEWYADNVAARAPIPTYVVGKGFEEWKERLERNGNVTVIGTVDSLAPWYLGAELVIAPIFDGSGMKTKVAEALMYGKPILGTPEAFAGYEEFADQIGVVCHDARQFLEALTAFSSTVSSVDGAHLRQVYVENFSQEAMRRNLERILGE